MTDCNIRLAEIVALANAATLAWLPGYEIHSDGTVWSVSSNWRGYGKRELTKIPNSDGYARIRALYNGGRKSFIVHKLIAEAFMPPCPDDCDQIRHLDGNRMNPSLLNLAWGNAKMNADDRERHGNTARGIRNGFSKIDDGIVKLIRYLRAFNGLSTKEISIRFGVSQSAVQRVLAGKRWSHVE